MVCNVVGTVCREAVRDSHLRGVADVQRLARKLAARKVSLQELCQLYMASNQLPALIDALGCHQGASQATFDLRLPDVSCTFAIYILLLQV
jgi:DNA mismatch repair ATPase MutS